MFWKIIRWGGTALIIIVAVAAVVLGSPDTETTTTVQPASQPAANKDFNL
jgi:hypothetical protein